MRSALSTLLRLTGTAAPAQDQDLQRALIQRDQQSAEFAAQIRGGVDVHRAMETLHERQRLSSESQTELRLTPPLEKPAADPLLKPLPLPGGPRPVVEPIAQPSLGG